MTYLSISFDGRELLILYDTAVRLVPPRESREMDGYDTPSGRLYHRFLILDATSNLAAAISVPLRNDRETRPEPRFETELILVQFFIPDSTPSIRDVTSASITRSETSLQVQDTEMERDCGDGVYCTSRRGIVARPATAATTISSSTENAGI